MCIVGPTAGGKSALAMALAAEIPCEIICCDARTAYRGMDIGTAKPTAAEQATVPHHGLDYLKPIERGTVVQWLQIAKNAIAAVHARKALPLVVGGTMLYSEALARGGELPPEYPELRAQLEAELARDGEQALWQRLQQADPQAAADTDPRNTRRVVRALEIALGSGRSKYSYTPQPAPWPVLWLGVHPGTEQLQQRIAARAQSMWTAGWPAEVAALLAAGVPADAPGMGSIGYGAVAAHLHGELTAAEAQMQITIGTRQYAARQMKWWKRNDQIHWL